MKSSELKQIGDQECWEHYEDYDSGFFHTFDNLKINHFDNGRKIHVYLPHEYYTSDRRYPVVYMNDAETTFWANGLSPYSWDVQYTLSELYKDDAIDKVIIVAVHHYDRNYEYLLNMLSLDILKKPLKICKKGGLPEYAVYLTQLKEFIDTNYKTDSDSKKTAIVGSSHGGLASFYTACYHYQHFGLCGALSSSFWADSYITLCKPCLMNLVGPKLHEASTDHPKLWIDWGLIRTGGLHNCLIENLATESSIKMIDLLQKEYSYIEDKDLFWFVDELGTHDERAWKYRFKLLLKKFYGK